jgi:hypothetical protein
MKEDKYQCNAIQDLKIRFRESVLRREDGFINKSLMIPIKGYLACY